MNLTQTLDEIKKAFEQLEKELSQKGCTISKQVTEITILKKQNAEYIERLKEFSDVDFTTEEKGNPCVHCQGTGVKPGYTDVPCAKCYGSGKEAVKEKPKGKCSDCNGTGKVPGQAVITCLSCKGTGDKR